MNDLKNLKCLLPKTEALLLKLAKSCCFLKKYVLVGGSALSLHLCHRKSEDLDFFTYEDNFSKQEIFEYIKNFEQKEILNQTDEQIDLLLDGVKVTFFNAKWAFLKPLQPQSFNLATFEQIAAMKINVLFLRAKYRDYYDIYFLAKKMSLREMFEKSKYILEGVTYKLFSIALLYTDDIEDDNISYLEPKETITKEKIRDFFQQRV
ncbi:MAG: nucleotidyl transferase AbiEii/AbiGii toxin family protein [Sulfurospirillaceae bacterium]|nr:nucleotidyl transferase AbiEii/AbiGii toxin family protein [Sulfurospirillaceae bacterium]MDD3463338.1 nucleotidyl transferase AbiEii/AbiGii toxin family protein [Sulfurospirillaceae bacterium]